MSKELKAGVDIPKLLEADSATRIAVLKELSRYERVRVVEGLVESVMLLGLTTVPEIIDYLGVQGLKLKGIGPSIERIKKKWIAETEDVVEFAKSERVKQIRKSWEEVRKCEIMYNDAKSIGDKVKVKQLQLQWLQYVAKLSLVDKMVETPDTGTNVLVYTGIESAEPEKD